MKRPIVSKDSLDLQSNHFLRRRSGYPIGASLGELDYLRGWKDDFLGDALHEQYTIQTVGGAVALQNQVGGVVRMIANVAGGPGNYARLWLGDAADGYATLDVDEGWIQMGRLQISDTTTIQANMGARDAAGNNLIDVGYDSVVGANWILRTRTGGGAINTVDSGQAADTDYHWFVLPVSLVSAVRTADFYLDGSLVASTTTSVPAIALTPVLTAVQTGGNRALRADVWNVIPRNL